MLCVCCKGHPLAETSSSELDRAVHVQRVGKCHPNSHPPHPLQRLTSIGLSLHSCNWFASYLNNRVHQVKNGSILSEPLTTTKGVPQGSFLGPTLIFIYNNDVAENAGNSKIHLYADDTILHSVSPSRHSAASALQLSLTSIEQYLHSLISLKHEMHYF